MTRKKYDHKKKKKKKKEKRKTQHTILEVVGYVGQSYFRMTGLRTRN
jgi:hypothetical protein